MQSISQRNRERNKTGKNCPVIVKISNTFLWPTVYIAMQKSRRVSLEIKIRPTEKWPKKRLSYMFAYKGEINGKNLKYALAMKHNRTVEKAEK